ncbi:MAG: porin [Fuerstiella sp.]|nr:porin [Fuerstiella sp.]MCP4512998.1 porin [Fuerstiella sp.]MDG2126740.1 outer membrane beta-barrel protein [Fuerstiella sp.]
MTRKPCLTIASMAILSVVGLNAVSAADGYGQQRQGMVYNVTDCDYVFGNSGSSFTSQFCNCTTSECCNDVGCCNDGCGEGCGSKCCLGDAWKIDQCDDGIDFGGWWQQGYSSASTGMFNNQPNRFNTNQAWLYAEKVADGSCGMDWGFRADMMYGIDAGDTQAFGNNAGRWDFGNGWDTGGGYGWAMPQLYAEIAKGDWSVKAGHFYTLLGYEVVTAPDNFFYSHAMTMFNSEAFTHTGVLATYAAGDDATIYAGWTLGWDTGFDQFGGGSNFLGGFSVPVGENATYTYILTAGDMGVNGDGYSHSNVLDVSLTDNLNYVIQSDLVSFNPVGGGTQRADVGINQYLLYSVNDCLGLGARFEWWKSNGGFNMGSAVPLNPTADADSYYALTLGANIKPHANVIIRPEWRYDTAPESVTGYSQGMFAIDMILTF